MGTREHIIAYLAQASELFDANGMASTQLAAAVGYPGSSVAFAQLLSGMERSGLIEREVRGKRTYRISLRPAQAVGAVAAAGYRAAGPAGADRVNGAGSVNGAEAVGEANEARAGMPGFDYDELARRLLAQVARRLAETEPGAAQPAPSGWRQTIIGLESELASAWAEHGKLAEENFRLREQLKLAQHSLALTRERVRRLPVATGLDHSEMVLLQRLLSPEYGGPEYGGPEYGDPGSDTDGLKNPRSLLS